MVPTKITEQSYVSLGILFVLAGCLTWVGALAGQVTTNTQEIAELRTRDRQIAAQHLEIMISLAEIKTELKKIKK